MSKSDEKLPEPCISDMSVRSALCIIPPETQWPAIQSIRELHDPAFTRWMPHINLLFPFVDEKHFERIGPYVCSMIAKQKIKAFDICFNEVTKFDRTPSKKKNNVLFLKPSGDECNESLQRIFKLLKADWTKLASKHGGDYSPHLTLGKFTGAELEKYKNEFNAAWKPISFRCDCLYLISRRGDDPFVIRQKIPLYDGTTSIGIGNEIAPKIASKMDEKEAEMAVNKADYSVIDMEPQIYFVIDTTGSMSSYISSLNAVLDQIFTMIKILFGGKASLHIISYKDYCDKVVIEQCHDNNKGGGNIEIDTNDMWPCAVCTFKNKASVIKCEMCNAVKPAPMKNKIREWTRTHLIASGGGDTPEAAKTALNVLYQYIVEKDPFKGQNNSMVFVYTDAPPHHDHVGSNKKNINAERKFIEKNHGKDTKCPGFDWIDICKSFKTLNIPIYTFLSQSIQQKTKSFWSLLGDTILMPDTRSDTITKATIGCINQLMGCLDENKYAASFKLSRYETACPIFEIENELSTNGYLPPNCSKQRMISGNFGELKALPFLSSVLGNLPMKLLKDEKFRDLVFEEFDRSLFTKENVLCLSYNNVFGTIWRKLCRFREDDRLKILKDKFGNVLMKLSERERKEMQAWIDISYDETERINEIIENHLMRIKVKCEEKESVNADADADDDEVEYVTLDAIDGISAKLLPTKKELLTIANSLYGDIVYKVQNVMTHLITIKAKNAKEHYPYDGKNINSFVAIPSSLRNKTFFSMLSHLVTPGTMFTLRPTLIMAMIAFMSGNVLLKDRAKEFLLEYRGKWINLNKLETFPEYISVPFVKLVTRCNRAMKGELLTVDESKFYKELYMLYRVRSSRPKKFDIEIGFTPTMNQIHADIKQKCVKCGEKRSFSLICPDGVCGKCKKMEIDPYTKECAEYSDLSDDTSHLVSCKSCYGIYAIINLAACNVDPKCHYCRNGVQREDIPALTCTQCTNRWICPKDDFFANRDKWTCPCCQKLNKAKLDTKKVSFECFVAEYPKILSILFGIESTKELMIKDMFSSMSLFKLYMRYKEALFVDNSGGNNDESKQNEDENRLIAVKEYLQNSKWNGRKIMNLAALCDDIFGCVQRGKLSEVCCLCFSEKPLVLLESACGNCSNLMCGECLGTWYNMLKPGQLVLPSHLLCPLCKCKPTIATMKKYNKEICTIIGGKKRESMKLSTQHYYGWCLQCYQIKPAIPRECLRENVPNLKDFECEDCVEERLKKGLADEEMIKKSYKQCPGCKHATVKISGCNHITCSIDGCGTHWCYECGKAFDPSEIYEHMAAEHGY